MLEQSDAWLWHEKRNYIHNEEAASYLAAFSMRIFSDLIKNLL